MMNRKGNKSIIVHDANALADPPTDDDNGNNGKDKKQHDNRFVVIATAICDVFEKFWFLGFFALVIFTGMVARQQGKSRRANQLRIRGMDQQQQQQSLAGDFSNVNAPPAITIPETVAEKVKQQKDETAPHFPPGCHWKCYVDRYPDLTKALKTEALAANHFIKSGKREGRSCDCCCSLHFFENAGEALTENIADLHHCGDVISYKAGSGSTSKNYLELQHYPQFLQMKDLLTATRIVDKVECVKFYQSHKIERDVARLAMSSTRGQKHGYRYDGIAVAKLLRMFQEVALPQCGINAPKFASTSNQIGRGVVLYDEENEYEQLLLDTRSPSDSVIIVNHKLLNANELLSVCQSLNLSCSILDANNFFHQEESKDFCNVLKKFQGSGNPLVIGVQRTEMFYPIFLSLRLFLVTDREFDNENENEPIVIDARRIGSVTKEGEIQVAPNLIRSAASEQQFDPYYPELSAMFGASLTPIRSSSKIIDASSPPEMEKNPNSTARNRKRKLCEVGSECADLDDVKRKLKKLIDDGKLLTKG